MKKYIITLIAAASIAVPVVALAHQGEVTTPKAATDVRQEDRGVMAQLGDNHGKLQNIADDSNKNDANENDANENQTEEAAEATPTPSASPSPTATPAVEDRMNDGLKADDNDTTEIHSSGHGSGSGHDGSDN